MARAPESVAHDLSVISQPSNDAVRKDHSITSSALHGVLLVVGAPCQLRSLAGQEHGRTSAARLAAIPAGESPANRRVQLLL